MFIDPTLTEQKMEEALCDSEADFSLFCHHCEEKLFTRSICLSVCVCVFDMVRNAH